MRYAFILVLLLNTLPIAHGNDSAVEGAGGSWQPLRGEHPNVRMVRETIRMDIYRRHYETVADFEFVNTGSATTVKMGFPEEAYPGEQPKKSSFLRFATTVDGKPAAVKRVLTRNDVDRDRGFSALWIKEVPFAKGQRRHIRVVYRSELGGAALSGPNRYAPYDFTGSNWQGTVAESTLSVVLHEPGYYLTRVKTPGKATISQQGARFDFRWKNWQAQGSFMFWLAKTVPEWMIVPGTIQLHDGTERTDAETISLLKTVVIEGKSSPDVDWAPPILMRKDVLFVRLRDFDTTPHFGDDSSTHATRTTGTIRVGAVRLNFWTDQRKMQVDGQASVELPAFPFCLRSTEQPQPAFYVPLEPVIKTLGGALNVNQSARRVYFRVPNM